MKSRQFAITFYSTTTCKIRKICNEKFLSSATINQSFEAKLKVLQQNRPNFYPAAAAKLLQNSILAHLR